MNAGIPMNRPLLTWLLAGALAASLSWNWTQLERAAPPMACAIGSCDPLTASGVCLPADQNAALTNVCERSCGEADRIERRAAELQHELLASLARPDVDAAAAQRLADEVGELRRQSLRACVDGILEVRKVLTSEQITTLLAQCERAARNQR